MITDHQIQRKDSSILLGIALENAVLDILTNDNQIQECLKMLQEPHRGFVCMKLGNFGSYPVTLNLNHDDTVSIFIDGPEFDPSRTQSAAIWVDKRDLFRLLLEARKGES